MARIRRPAPDRWCTGTHAAAGMIPVNVLSEPTLVAVSTASDRDGAIGEHRGVRADEHPAPPAVTVLTLDRGEHLPAGLIDAGGARRRRSAR